MLNDPTDQALGECRLLAQLGRASLCVGGPLSALNRPCRRHGPRSESCQEPPLNKKACNGERTNYRSLSAASAAAPAPCPHDGPGVPKSADDQGAPNRPPTHRCERGRKPLCHREMCLDQISLLHAPTTLNELKTTCWYRVYNY